MVVNNRNRFDVFQNLIYKVSQHALNMLHKQYLKIDHTKQPTVCTGKFKKTFGIPCTHQVRDSIESGIPLVLSDVHIQWHLQLNFHEDTIDTQEFLPSTPRKRLLEEMKEKLYRTDINAASLIARLRETLTSPFAQINPPNAVTKKKERPAGVKNKTSLPVTREKSKFEYVKERKCGQCGMPGHNSRTCKNKVN